MKTKSKIGGHIIRSTAYAVLLSLAFIALSLAFNSPNGWHKPAQATVSYNNTAKIPLQARALSFAERVVYQRGIEEVYWRHRIWPKENSDPKPALDAVMSQAQLEKKVADYLSDSLVLEHYWQKPITAEQLQAEMDRMARDTKQPEVLRELFEVLGNDPFVIAECLARPTLVERDFAVAESRTPFLEDSRAKVQTQRGYLLNANYMPPIVSYETTGCTPYWRETSTTNAPSARAGHTAVWTGSEMIIWGGSSADNSGGRYIPSTDSWRATSTANAPSARFEHTAVWTGTEMIVWGGSYCGPTYCYDLNTGGRYNPSTDSWTATSTTNAPTARSGNTAVWTGTEMIVWGGFDNTGGRYNPSTDSWIATSTGNAPTGRGLQTAVWSGSEMIVWGGIGGCTPNCQNLNTGGRYNPGTDSWTATSTANAPAARYFQASVWSGSEMIVWGGFDGSDYLNTGGKYDPSTDTWTATSTANAPAARYFQTSVWSGSEMIVWGGFDGSDYLNTGGKYDPNTDSWTVTTTTNPPSARIGHTAVWTGSEMVVWGGSDGSNVLNTGGRYCAQSGAPRPQVTPRPRPTPAPRP